MSHMHPSPKLNAIIVGSRRDELLGRVIAVLARYNTSLKRCDNIYSALANLACCHDSRQTIIVARPQTFARENAALLRKAAERDYTCCCLLTGNNPYSRVHKHVSAGTSILCVNQPEQISKIVEQFIPVTPAPAVTVNRSKPRPKLSTTGFQASKEEIDALLGVTSDETAG